MDVKYINPFINSLINTLEMMMGMSPDAKSPYIKGDSITQGDITGIIGFAEKNITGSIALSFPQDTALKIYNAMTGDNVFRVTRDVEDSIGELTNIVAGGAKTVLAAEGYSFHISIPSVIVGKNHQINHKANAPIVVIPFQVESIRFSMEVSMLINEND
jgi:chemotaxis protein CheX